MTQNKIKLVRNLLIGKASITVIGTILAAIVILSTEQNPTIGAGIGAGILLGLITFIAFIIIFVIDINITGKSKKITNFARYGWIPWTSGIIGGLVIASPFLMIFTAPIFLNFNDPYSDFRPDYSEISTDLDRDEYQKQQADVYFEQVQEYEQNNPEIFEEYDFDPNDPDDDIYIHPAVRTVAVISSVLPALILIPTLSVFYYLWKIK